MLDKTYQTFELMQQRYEKAVDDMAQDAAYKSLRFQQEDLQQRLNSINNALKKLEEPLEEMKKQVNLLWEDVTKAAIEQYHQTQQKTVTLPNGVRLQVRERVEGQIIYHERAVQALAHHNPAVLKIDMPAFSRLAKVKVGDKPALLGCGEWYKLELTYTVAQLSAT